MLFSVKCRGWFPKKYGMIFKHQGKLDFKHAYMRMHF